MTTTAFNDAEDEALQGLRMRTQVIYLRGLRRFMDYETGVVGIRRRISYQSLREVSEFVPDEHSTSQPEKLGRSGIRAALHELERHGLIEKKSEDTLVFFLPLADTDRSARNMSDPSATHQRPRISDPGNGSDNNNIVDMSDPSATHQRPRISDPPPVSGKETTTTRAGARERFAMTAAWVPDRNYVDMHIGMQGMKSATDDEWREVLGEFKAYWVERCLAGPAIAETDGEWTRRLVRSLKHYRRRQTGDRNAKGGGLSAPDRVTQAYADAGIDLDE